MAAKVTLSGDGASISFSTSEQAPTTLRKFRQSQEVEGLYRFIFENDLQKEAYDIIESLLMQRKNLKIEAKIQAKAQAKQEAIAAKVAKQAKAVKVPTAKPLKEAKVAKAAKPSKPIKSAKIAKKTKKK
ncbi:MAG: hypothetical protein SGJ18_05610 [Pseudomonadota bacterium]|nr:hypothetical protein [Pseudomonadota bacterium]